mgnify:CR=1 FL=1
MPPAAPHAASGASAGDTLKIEVTLDRAVREVELPEDLAAAFKKHKAAAVFFTTLAPSHKKEWVRWITEAKKPETRSSRVAKTVEALTDGKKTR